MIWLIVFLFCVLGALFFKFKVKGYSALSVYLTAIAIIVAGYFLLSLNESPLFNGLRIVLNCIVFLLLLMFIIAEIPVIIYSKKRIKANSKYAIVLGAGVNNGKPSKVLNQRILAAKEFMVLYPETILILSGGKVEDENLSEAECMQNELIKSGIDKNRLILEDKSKTTVENFRFSKELLADIKEITVITSDTHLYRACFLAKKAGFNPFPFYAKNTLPVLRFSTQLKEAVAIWELWLFKNKKHEN